MPEDVRTETTRTAVPPPETDTLEDFENQSQRNAGEQTDSQTAWEVNRKRTYDLYQDFDAQAVRANQRTLDRYEHLSLQAMQNAIETSNMVAKQSIRHADVAADALWTDELNPVTRAAGNDITGQSPVNAALSSTASLDTVYTNLTSQIGIMTTQVVGLAQSIVQSNVQISANNAASIALLAQLVENSKQAPAAAPKAA